MASSARIFNHWGEYEKSIDVTTTPRGWVLNGYGRCDFAIPFGDANLTERLIQFGNFIHIEHRPEEGSSNGRLPNWTGIIVPPRTWNKDAVVVSAVTVEAVFAFRAMPYVKVEGSPDQCFKQIVDYARASTPNTLQIFPGRIDTQYQFGGQVDGRAPAYSDELRTNAYDHIKKMIGLVGMDWDITGEILPESLALQLKANLYARKGRDGLRLTSVNTDEASPLLTEQGTIINQIFAYSQAQTEQTRVMQEIRLQESIDKYGPFQNNVVYIGVTDSGGLLNTAGQTRVNERGDVVRMVKRTALNHEDTFAFLDVGNVCTISDSRVGFNPDGSLGFSATARVLSMDYNDTTDKVALNVELKGATSTR